MHFYLRDLWDAKSLGISLHRLMYVHCGLLCFSIFMAQQPLNFYFARYVKYPFLWDSNALFSNWTFHGKQCVLHLFLGWDCFLFSNFGWLGNIENESSFLWILCLFHAKLWTVVSSLMWAHMTKVLVKSYCKKWPFYDMKMEQKSQLTLTLIIKLSRRNVRTSNLWGRPQDFCGQGPFLMMIDPILNFYLPIFPRGQKPILIVSAKIF